MRDMHIYKDRLRTGLVAVLLTIVLLALGVQTAFAGFCWAG